MKFIKMQALGNDYIYLDCLETEPPTRLRELAKTLSRRRFSVGADGLVLILPSSCCDVKMRIFNADGSEAEICGNALRCVARYIFDKRGKKNGYITIETACGVKRVKKSGELFFVRMGKAIITGVDPYTVSVGNPHMVVFTDDVDSFDFEAYEHFDPKSFNTEAVEITDGCLKMRVYERGSGETLACGSGACAAVAAAVYARRLNFGSAEVRLPGGKLSVEIDENYDITLCGAAGIVYYGEVQID